MEALAVVDALEIARHFVLGCTDLTIAVDHKPLLKVVGDRSLEDIPNPRLENLKEKTLRYRFKMIHIPGKSHKAPDSISRHPTGNVNPEGLLLEDDISSVRGKMTTSLNASMTSFLHGIRQTEDEPSKTEEDIQAMAVSTLDTLQSVTWDKVRIATNSDENLRKLGTSFLGVQTSPSQLTISRY